MVILPSAQKSESDILNHERDLAHSFCYSTLHCIDPGPSLLLRVNAYIDGYLNWSKPQRNVELSEAKSPP